MTVSLLPKGTNFARLAVALARGKADPLQAAEIAEAEWGVNSSPAKILRSAIAAGTTTDPNWAASLAEYRVAAAEFIEALRPATILGKLNGYRRVPGNIKVPRVTSGSGVGWVGQSRAIKVSRLSLDTLTLDIFAIAGIVVSTQELVKLSTPAADGLIRADLIAAVAAMMDQALVDPDAVATDISPASITAGADTIASVGITAAAAAQDFRALVRTVFDNGVDLKAPFFVTGPRVAAGLAFMTNAADVPAFPNVTVRGGEIGGIPLIVSSSAPADLTGDSPDIGDYDGSVTLLDAAELLVADTDQITIDVSGETTLQLDDSPDSPPTGNTNLINLWQHNLAAWRVVRPVNWKMRRPGAVAVLTGVNY